MIDIKLTAFGLNFSGLFDKLLTEAPEILIVVTFVVSNALNKFSGISPLKFAVIVVALGNTFEPIEFNELGKFTVVISQPLKANEPICVILALSMKVVDVNLVFWNALSPIDSILLEIVTLLKSVEPKNIELLIDVRPVADARLAVVNVVIFEKADAPIDVKLADLIVKVVNFVLAKAESPIDVIFVLPDNTSLVKPALLNALFPMEVTLSKLIEVSAVFSWNALAPIEFIELGIVTVFNEVSPANIESLIEVRVFALDKSTVVNVVILAKADAPIVVKLAGNDEISINLVA